MTAPAKPTPYHPASVTLEEAQAAYDAWGANCGPGAIAAILDTTLEKIRPNLGDFPTKKYTNPRLMYQILDSLGVKYTKFIAPGKGALLYTRGLARIQWDGAWTQPGAPWYARQRHTHWIATRLINDKHYVFDINTVCVGWVPLREWIDQVAPWLIQELIPEATGWSITHTLDILGGINGQTLP